jgi:maleamate amidohydrolase
MSRAAFRASSELRGTLRLSDAAIYERQGFGARLAPRPAYALLVVDFVVGFAAPEAFGGGNIEAAISRTRYALAEARARRWPVAHSRIVFAEGGSDQNVFSRKVPTLGKLTEHDPSSQIVDALTPAAGELVVRKTLPSAFAGTPLLGWLTMRGIRTLLIAGCTTSGCVRATVLDAMNAGFLPFVLEDCVGDRARGPHEANLFDMAQKYAEVVPLTTALTLIDASEIAPA